MKAYRLFVEAYPRRCSGIWACWTPPPLPKRTVIIPPVCLTHDLLQSHAICPCS